MNTNTHPIEQEELMAHLDGELWPERATVVAAHLASCDECQKFVTDLKSVSHDLQSWQVESPGAGLFLPVDTKVEEKVERSRRSWLDRYPIAWGVSAAVILVIVVAGVRLIGTSANTIFTQADTMNEVTASPRENKKTDRLEQFSKLQKPPAVRGGAVGGGFGGQPASASASPVSEPGGNSVSAPMIVRTAELGITVQEFDRAHSHLDEILARHRGYLGGLQISSPSNQGRVLNGVLRIPVGQMDSALTELKSLGHVDSESQNGEEVTAQYVDLQARLDNARHTEQRLTEVLQQRTGKLSDVLAVETEIARVRGEIESMEAERKSMATSVAFATLNVTLTEDYKPKLQTVPPSTFRQFRNSAVEGYQTMAAGIISLVNAALFYGPSLLLWAALAFFPARYAWRRLTAKAA